MASKVKVVKVEGTDLSKKINKGASLSASIKSMEVEMSTIKEYLSTLEPAKYVTKEGKSVTISESSQFSDVGPEEAKMALREKRLGRNFMECIKVNLTSLKRYLSDTEISKLRSKVGTIRKYSFK